MAIFGGRQIKLTDLAKLCRRVGTSLQAGVDARRVWDREAQQATGAARLPLRDINDSIARGESFAVAFERNGDAFPKLLRALVKVGEKAGQTDRVFLRLADNYESTVRLKRTFLVGIFFPVMQLLAAIVIVGVLIWILGFIAHKNNGVPIDVLGFGLIGTSGLVKYIIFLFCVVLAILTTLALVKRNEAIANRLFSLVMRVPVLRDYLRTVAQSRFAWCLSMTHEAGMNIQPCVALALAATNNGYYTQHRKSIDAGLKNGQPIHQTIAATGAFSPDFVHSVTVGEESGRLSETLDQVSEQYEHRARSQAAALATAGAFAVWGLVAFVIIVLIFRLAMFYVGTIQDAVDSIG